MKMLIELAFKGEAQEDPEIRIENKSIDQHP